MTLDVLVARIALVLSMKLCHPLKSKMGEYEVDVDKKHSDFLSRNGIKRFSSMPCNTVCDCMFVFVRLESVDTFERSD